MTDDDVTVISTAIAVLYRASPKRGSVAMPVMANGKIGKISQERAVKIVEEVCQLAGHESGKHEAAARRFLGRGA